MFKNQIESLQNLIADGIIEPSEGKEKIYMLKEKAVKEIHNRAISQRTNGRFVTKVEATDKLRQITATTYDELICKLYDFYFGVLNSTLESLYSKWVTYRKEECPVTAKTIKENGYLWNAHLKGQPITTRPIKNLRPTDFVKFFRQMTKDRTMTRKRFNDVKSIMNGIYYYAIENDIVRHNPLNEINYKQFAYKPEKAKCPPFSEEERIMMINHVNGLDLYSLAILLDFHLVLRIGELKGLRFDDIYGDMILIQRFVNDKEEIVNDIKGHTSYGYRWQPLTSEAKKIISKIKELNPNSEYMFFRDGKPLCTCTFNRRMKKYCQELNIPYRSSHQIRFGNASLLHQKGVSAPEIQPMLGHSNLGMTEHYLKNIVPKDATIQKFEDALNNRAPLCTSGNAKKIS